MVRLAYLSAGPIARDTVSTERQLTGFVARAHCPPSQFLLSFGPTTSSTSSVIGSLRTPRSTSTLNASRLFFVAPTSCSNAS